MGLAGSIARQQKILVGGLMIKKVLSLIAICLMLSACQSTPREETIIQSGDFLNGLTEVPFTPCEAPQRVEQETNATELEIIFAADVIIPDASAYSIVELEQIKYTKDDYKGFMEHFCPSAKWFEQPERTKAEILESYWAIQNNTRIPNEQKSQFDFMLETAKTAPETAELIPFDLAAHLQEEYGFTAWAYRDENEEPSTFSISPLECSWNYARLPSGTIYQESFLDFDHEEDVYMKKDFQHEPIISQADAVSIAQEALDALGFDSAIKLYSVEKGITYRNFWPVTYGWQCIFTRDYSGIQLPDAFGAWSTWKNSPPPSYAAPWSQEMVVAFVDDIGLNVIGVRGPSKEKDVLYKNIALLPFNKLLERIEKQLMYQHAYYSDGITEKSCRVTSIELLGSMIAERNKPGFALFIPSWRVNYVLSYTEYGTQIVLDDNATFFNAIDGSYIEPRASADMLGYS